MLRNVGQKVCGLIDEDWQVSHSGVAKVYGDAAIPGLDR
jgi:hypothetical protein